MDKPYRLTKYACYLSSISMAAVITLSPMLFITFHDRYGISFTLLGLLVLINFCTQLSIDLVFSFFSEKFNLALTVRVTPLITFFGILVYAVMPTLFPNSAYLWIAVGTAVFSLGAGLCEVLLSPTIAAIPCDNPEREMSRFHAVYAWGVVLTVIVSACFLRFFGSNRWYLLALFFALFPAAASVFFALGNMPPVTTGVSDESSGKKTSIREIVPFILCIFFGSAAENTMSQWCSGFVETAVGLPKFWGDMFGMLLFAVMLGLARTLYGKYGKNISRVLLLSFIGAAICYLTVGLVTAPPVCMIACILCGLCVSMLWPGTLIWVENVHPGCGVVIYALLAAAGDFGASVAPQLMGIITDAVAASPIAETLGTALRLLPDQIGMKAGMLLSMLFPLVGILIVLSIRKNIKKTPR